MKIANGAKISAPARRRSWPARPRGPGSRRGSRPETPLLKWRVEEKERNSSVLPVEDEDDVGSRSEGRWRSRRRSEVGLSSRKLAAGLWRLQVLEQGRCGDGFCVGKGSAKHMRSSVAFHHCNRKVHNVEKQNAQDSPYPVSSAERGFLFKVEHSFKLSSSAMEGATKWDPNPTSFGLLDEVNQVPGRTKLLNQQDKAVSVTSALESELEQARSRIVELEMEHRSSNKNLELFLKKVSEEKAAWRRREHEKIRAFFDNIKSDLSRGKKNCQRMEILNSKLVNDLAEAKLSTKRLMQEYEKERKTRVLVEEMCDELMKEIEEDKSEAEALKKELTKLQEEVDEERKMLQMAEVWREERVQMKLLDAKVVLEEKYSQMRKVATGLEKFILKSRNAPEVKDIREAEALWKAAASVNIQDLKEFAYEPSNADDIFSVLEEVALGGNCMREIELCVKDNGSVSRRQTGTMSNNEYVEGDESGWETVSNLDDQGSSFSPESVKDCRQNTHATGEETPITDISEVCSVFTKQPKRVSSIARLLKSNGENCKLVSVESTNGRISNGGVGSPDHGSRRGEFSPSDVVGCQWSPPETGNSHVTREMKGCIEWPRGSYKSSLKAKLLKASMESQKVQLKHVLKQKI